MTKFNLESFFGQLKTRYDAGYHQKQIDQAVKVPFSSREGLHVYT
jgi:hypothetical protein